MMRSSTFDRVFWNQLSQDNLLSGFFRKALAHRSSAAYIHFETGADSSLRSLLSRVYQEYFHPDSYSPQLMNALMREFFILLLRRYEGTARLPRTQDFYWKHEFSAILSYIQLHYASDGVEDVAAHFHYNRKQIARIVQKYTGSTYAQLALRLRMEKACFLLRQGGLSMSDIAVTCGYSTLSSSHRALSAYQHCTPSVDANQAQTEERSDSHGEADADPSVLSR